VLAGLRCIRPPNGRGNNWIAMPQRRP
jgi:hypothetical protein